MLTVVLPAYNCSHTLEKKLDAIPKGCVDNVLLVVDDSTDNTLELAQSLGIKHVYEHSSNMGYGTNQKTCNGKALEMGADIIIMLHPYPSAKVVNLCLFLPFSVYFLWCNKCR